MEKDMTIENISFEVMNDDKVVCRVDYKGGVHMVSGVRLDRCFCPRGISRADLLEYFEERCIPRTRPDIKIILRGMGLSEEYDPFEFVKKTRGYLVHDTFWIRFPWDSWIKNRKQLEEVIEEYNNASIIGF